MSESLAPTKRRHIRFPADPGDVATIDFGAFDRPFAPTISALISEEAPMGGCGLVLLASNAITTGTELRVKVGRLAPLRGVVQWRRLIDDGVIRLGVQFLE